MENNWHIKKLEWDSLFFGLNVGKITIENEINEDEMINLNKLSQNFQFYTINNVGNLFNNNVNIGKHTNGYLADVNIQFKKKIKRLLINDYPDIEIKITNFKKKSDKIIELSSNFNESRFVLDSNFEKDVAIEMYKEWVKNSFERENKYFSIASYNDKVIGFLLFSVKGEGEAIIELLSISNEYRGKGFGKKLVNKTEEKLYELDITKLKVGTQLNNSVAINFYHSMGFKQVDLTSIYHCWNR